jgi:hypothetical protein
MMRNRVRAGAVMSKPIDKVIYERAAQFIERGWTQEVYARNASGKNVSPFAKTAVQFCAAGALMRGLHTKSTAARPKAKCSR